MKQLILNQWHRIILLGILIVSIPRIASVMSEVEPALFGYNIGPITGAGYGLLMELSLFHMFVTWTEANRRGRKHSSWLLAGCVIMLLLIATVVTPHVWANITQQPLGRILITNWFGYVWTVLMVVIPSFAAIFLALTEWFKYKEYVQEDPGHLPSLPEATLLSFANQSVTYFLQSGHGGNIKIGHTTNLAKRLPSLQTANSEELRIVGLVAGGTETEDMWHQKLQKYNVRGEWFAPKPAVVRALQGMTTSPGDAPVAEAIVVKQPPSPKKTITTKKQQSRKGGYATTIATLLQDNPKLTVTEIAAQVGCDKSTASRWRKRILGETDANLRV